MLKLNAWCAKRENDGTEPESFVIPTLSRDLTLCRDKVKLQRERYPTFFNTYPITGIVRVEIREVV